MTKITIPVKFTDDKFLLSSSQEFLEKTLPSFWGKEKKKVKPKTPNNPKCVLKLQIR